MTTRQRFATVVLIAAVPVLSACTGEKTWYRPWGDSAAQLAQQYRNQLDIHVTVDQSSNPNHPVAHVTVTNIGRRDVNYLRFVAVANATFSATDYHDVRVLKPLTSPTGEQTLLPRDGGTTSFLVDFRDYPTPPAANTRIAVDLRLTEIGFTK